MAGSFCSSSFCCCGCAVREGTLALLYITTVFWSIICILFLGDDKSKGAALVVLVCFVLPKIAGIYGVHQKIPMLLIPQMIIQWIIIFFWSIFLLFFIFARGQAMKSFDKWPSFIKDETEIDDTVNSFFMFFIISLLLCIGFQYHLFTVVNGYFSEMCNKRNVPPQIQMTKVNNFGRW